MSSTAARYRAIINPAAGGGRCGRRYEALRHKIVDRLESEHRTSRPGHATELAREAVDGGIRHLLAVGGDGTVLEVLNGALRRSPAETPCVLSVLPLGTGNSLVRHFTPQGRRPVESAVEALLDERRTRSDVLVVRHVERGAVRSKLALSSVTFGLPTRVADVVNRRLKFFGIFGYSVSVVIELVRLLHETYDGTSEPLGEVPRSSWMLCCQNTATVGGAMRLAPEADMADGLFELVWGERSSRMSLIHAFPRIFRGTHVDHPAFKLRQVKRYSFERPMARKVMLDGEVEELTVRSVSVLGGAVELAL
ncbi:MAG: diacylglycerol kinase family protein [Acidobacteriota bacterium]